MELVSTTETWADLDKHFGTEACAIVDDAVGKLLESVRPDHEMNYLDSEGGAWRVLTALKGAGYRIVKDG